jgi:hypothetical protein
MANRTSGLVTLTPIEAMRQDRKKIMAKLETLSADNARLREALAKCITDHGATGYTNNVVYGRRRLDAISETARAALAKGGA